MVNEKEYQRQYYLTHREELKKRAKTYRLSHIEHTRQVDRNYYREHRVETLEKNKLPARRWITARSYAKHEGREWSISFEEYYQLLRQGCFYSGKSLSDETGIGLDRIDNSKGYTLDNVLPCCGECNSIRGNKLTVDEMQYAMLAVLMRRS